MAAKNKGNKRWRIKASELRIVLKLLQLNLKIQPATDWLIEKNSHYMRWFEAITGFTHLISGVQGKF